MDPTFCLSEGRDGATGALTEKGSSGPQENVRSTAAEGGEVPRGISGLEWILEDSKDNFWDL